MSMDAQESFSPSATTTPPSPPLPTSSPTRTISKPPMSPNDLSSSRMELNVRETCQRTVQKDPKNGTNCTLKRTADQSLGLDQSDSSDCSVGGKKIMIVETKPYGTILDVEIIFNERGSKVSWFRLSSSNFPTTVHDT
ncbi:hypothetical protein FGIG_01873 [Fasciola gigantica]|uniref:Uncharacterized protein n=1 Tax=Fasciola gigantica TaxID=46835 RepID=A0A504YY09_FASGI|nr:hypothetical protein FGIG_01873 [Fasciola gigantica]